MVSSTEPSVLWRTKTVLGERCGLVKQLHMQLRPYAIRVAALSEVSQDAPVKGLNFGHCRQHLDPLRGDTHEGDVAVLAYGRQIAATECIAVVAECMIHGCFFSLILLSRLDFC